MNVTKEQIFEVKQRLQQEIQQFEGQLKELIVKQAQIKKIDVLAQSILQYEDLQNHISDRAHLFALFSSPPESLRRPMVKSQLFSYVEAAETIGVDMVNFLIDDFLHQIRLDIQAGEDDEVDLIHAEFKEYIIPGKIIAERFEEIDDLLSEMNRYCKVVDPQYDEARARDVLVYAFEISVNADTRMEPTVHALREIDFGYITPEDRGQLLDKVQERLAIIQYDQMRTQNIAMEKAVKMMSEREEKAGK